MLRKSTSGLSRIGYFLSISRWILLLISISMLLLLSACQGLDGTNGDGDGNGEPSQPVAAFSATPTSGVVNVTIPQLDIWGVLLIE